ncbi:MAG: hypothetical protein IKU76_05825 [Bacteroidaceae bacterium]|nr:hypothetical protein [Bacteroidaceae bacterium]
MAVKQAGTRRKSEARIAKDRKKKADAKRRKMVKQIAIIVAAIAFATLMIFAFTAPPKVM